MKNRALRTISFQSPLHDGPAEEYGIGYKAGYEIAAGVDIPAWLEDNGFQEAANALTNFLNNAS